MSECTIFFPGLLGPSVSLDEYQNVPWPAKEKLHNLSRLLSIGKTRKLFPYNRKNAIEAQMLHCLGVENPQSNDIPAALIRCKQFQLNPEYRWCLDPVYMQVDVNEVVLAGNEILDLSEAEAHSLIDDLNRHFVEDDIHIEFCTPHRWVLKAQLDLSASSLWESLFTNINEHQPVGPAARYWQGIINEIQMFLYAHSVNQQREVQGKKPVNSLWLWGGGEKLSIETNIERIYTDDAFLMDLASVNNISCSGIPDRVNSKEVAKQNTLFALTDHIRAVRTDDVFGWLDALISLENNLLSPIASMLRANELTALNLNAGVFECRLSASDFKRNSLFFWRRPKSPEEYIKQLRRQYGN